MLKLLFSILFFLPLIVIAQQNVTVVKGRVIDGTTGQPLSGISVSLNDSRYGITTDKKGNFYLSAAGTFSRVTFSYIGYQTITKIIKPGQVNELLIRFYSSQTQLKEVSITSGKGKRYRNKGNPAVELIQQVIDHKEQNRMESADYLQYDQYERTGLSLLNLPPMLTNSRLFSKYKFMLDTASVINGKIQTSLPAYFSEKLSRHFYRKNPEKSIQVLQAEKGINIVKFVDTVGVDIYLSRLYGNTIDIYDNNIFIITNQFLSPIANHAPDFYKFFITDTVQSVNGKLVELSFTPRNKGDLLFEGKLLVTMDGNYAVKACELDVNKAININFINSLKILLDFEQYPGGRYELVKSDVKADFGLLRNKSIGVFGERTVIYSDLKFNSPLPEVFYRGKSLQTAADHLQADTNYWNHHRTDTLTRQEAGAYARISRLEQMRSFKTATWIAGAFTNDFADIGPVQAGPIGSLLSYNTQEGARFQLGGRTTPKFNSSLYLNGYAGYGNGDRQLKYDLSTVLALNKTPPYRFPNDYFKLNYLYDVDIPGQSFAINNSQAALSSFQSGVTDYWLYDRIFSVSYIKDFENHFSYNLSFRKLEPTPRRDANVPA